MAKEVEPEEIIRLIDGVYKSIIEKFNPCARQLITAGKTYLKALQGATSASNVFNETLNKIAINAQQGNSSDIGDALINVVNVHKTIQEQHINILKAFYVDLLMPLENNLEKDTKVVQVEQKKFLQQHKANVESYCKAVTTLKKQRKKKNASGTTSKELKSLQAVEEQKNKLKTYCNQSLKNALTQERRRYGFVLERQCSIAKHWMSYHSTGKSLLDNNLDDWQQIAATRENVTLNLQDIFSKNKDGNKSNLESNSLLLRKTRSMEVAGGPDNKRDDRSFNQNSLPRTKSEHNLTMPSSASSHHPHNHRFSSSQDELVEELLIMKAVYTYEANGKNQLSFEEGDRIALIGGRVNGWQFGENLRTKMMGWFPVTYLEKDNQHHHSHHQQQQQQQQHYQQQQYQQHHNHVNTNNNNHQYHNDQQTPMSTLKRGMNSKSVTTAQQQTSDGHVMEQPSPTRMFGDTIQFRNTRYFQKISAADLRTSPPPAQPPPIPSAVTNGNGSNANHLNASQSFNFPKESHNMNEKTKRPIIYKANKHSGHNNTEMENPPPPQPEVDYSDEEENVPTRVPLRSSQNIDNQNMNRPVSSLYDDANASTRNSSPQQLHSSSYQIHQNQQYNYHNSNSNNNNNKSNSSNNLSNNSNNALADIDLNTLTRKDNFIKRTKSFWRSSKKHGDGEANQMNGAQSWRHEDIMNQQTQQQLPPGGTNGQNDNDADDEYLMNDNFDRRNEDYSPKEQPKTAKIKQQRQLTAPTTQHRRNQQQIEMNNINNGGSNTNKRTAGNKFESKTVTSMNFDKNHHRAQHHLSSKQQKYHNSNSFDSDNDDDSDNSTIKVSEINNNNSHSKNLIKNNHNNNNNNFDDNSTLGMAAKKPFKRREILKQYYNSDGDDDDDDENGIENDHNRQHDQRNGNHLNHNNNLISNNISSKNKLNNYIHNKKHNNNNNDDDDNDNDRDDTDIDVTDIDDTEHDDNDTTTSDPYDCIVIDDHLVKTGKMEFSTFKGDNQIAVSAQQKHHQHSPPQKQQSGKVKSRNMDGENNVNSNNNNNNNNKVNMNNNINKNNASMNGKMDSTSSGTLLPRTKLNKSTSKENHLNRITTVSATTQQTTTTSSSFLLQSADGNAKLMNMEKNNGFINNTKLSSSQPAHHPSDPYSDDSYSKSYGPWYDLWDDNTKMHNAAKS